MLSLLSGSPPFWVFARTCPYQDARCAMFWSQLGRSQFLSSSVSGVALCSRLISSSSSEALPERCPTRFWWSVWDAGWVCTTLPACREGLASLPVHPLPLLSPSRVLLDFCSLVEALLPPPSPPQLWWMAAARKCYSWKDCPGAWAQLSTDNVNFCTPSRLY